jgi:2-polyprenyl-3-methyl-5-hydroxy-6-metoxy-1,4-benzoquinol methylase
MDRSDLLTDEAKPTVDSINDLIKKLYSKGLWMTSWFGTLPTWTVRGILRRQKEQMGFSSENKGSDYQPLPNAADDTRIPWYLYWEIYWVMRNGPNITPNMRVLDAGGTSSLFSCYLASLGLEVHSIDMNKALVSNGNKIAKAMQWKMTSYVMDMRKLDFADEYFDHAYSICVFEHLNHETKKAALSEIARCLKPNGTLSITFDYRNPAPMIAGSGPDKSEENQIKNNDDIRRNFLSTGNFDLIGNQDFYDNQKSYLAHPLVNGTPYTFGAIFLKKRAN